MNNKVFGKVHRLSEDIIRQIAAGEVIERPASAVKELIENSIDAEASQIDIAIKHGGKECIKVSDNGTGILSEDATVVFEKYSTSKINSNTDLLSINTLGFRGEALHAIAFAAQKVILTTRHWSEDVGTKVIVENGNITDVYAISRNVGTTIKVLNLFANLPARSKFLKSNAFETRKIVDVVFRYIFAYPDKKISLTVDSKKKIDIVSHDPRYLYYAYISRYPEKVEEKSVILEDNVSSRAWIFFDSGNYQPFMFIAVNGRPVITGSIYAMIKGILREIYGTAVLPSIALWLTLKPELVDHNIHPAKLEVDVRDKPLVRKLLLNLFLEKESYGYIPDMKDAVNNATKNQWEEIKTVPTVIRMFTPEEEQRQVEQGEYRELPQIIDIIEDTYILYKYKGIKIADKHALMEGILFNVLWNQKDRYIQPLTSPWKFEVRDPGEMKEKLTQLGFEVTILSQNAIAIRGVPSLLTLRIWNKEMMGALIADIEHIKIGREKIADIACKLSIKAGEKNSIDFLQALIKIGEDYPESHYDPHGRPAVVQLNRDNLDKLFKRK